MGRWAVAAAAGAGAGRRGRRGRGRGGGGAAGCEALEEGRLLVKVAALGLADDNIYHSDFLYCVMSIYFYMYEGIIEGEGQCD